MVLNPDDASVLANDAILHVVGIAGLIRPVRFRDDPVTVVWVDDAHPQPRIGEPLGGRVSGELSILGAQVSRRHDVVEAST